MKERISIAEVLGRTFTIFDPDTDGLEGELIGTVEEPKLKVLKTGPAQTGYLGRYLKAGKTYSLVASEGLQFSDMLNYYVPDEEFEPTAGSCMVTLAVERFKEDEPLSICMELDS